MGKLVIQYVLPFLVVAPVVLWCVRKWWVLQFPKTVDNIVEVNKASEKHEKKLRKHG